MMNKRNVVLKLAAAVMSAAILVGTTGVVKVKAATEKVWVVTRVEDNSEGENYTHEYKYNKKGLISSEKNNVGSKTTYKYDKNSRLKKMKFENKDIMYLSITKYKYKNDKVAKSISTEYILDGGKKDAGYTETCEYTWAGDHCVQLYVDEYNAWTYTYDENGRVSGSSFGNGAGAASYSYDDRGYLKSISYSGGSINDYVITEEDGRVVKTERSDGYCCTYTWKQIDIPAEMVERVEKQQEYFKLNPDYELNILGLAVYQ